MDIIGHVKEMIEVLSKNPKEKSIFDDPAWHKNCEWECSECDVAGEETIYGISKHLKTKHKYTDKQIQYFFDGGKYRLLEEQEKSRDETIENGVQPIHTANIPEVVSPKTVTKKVSDEDGNFAAFVKVRLEASRRECEQVNTTPHKKVSRTIIDAIKQLKSRTRENRESVMMFNERDLSNEENRILLLESIKRYVQNVDNWDSYDEKLASDLEQNKLIE